jgi:hypothetical protein
MCLAAQKHAAAFACLRNHALAFNDPVALRLPKTGKSALVD